jgi:Cys-tRNA(Pro)/Cys-tRNA(Cys) deacylase
MAQEKTEITEYLDERKITYKVKYHSKPVFTSEEAALERGVKLSQIAKTMLLSDGEEVIVAVLPAHKRLDVKRLKKLSRHKNLQFMDRGSIEKKTALTVGAVAPIGRVLEGMSIFVDPSVFDEEFLDISSGDPMAGLELHRDALKGLLKEAIFAEITKEEK